MNGQKYTGNYYLQDSEGNYYTSENGPLKKAKNKTVCGSAVNGVVSSVPAGYTVVLEQILAGTSFEVNEINLNPTDYGNPEYSIEAAEDVNTTDKASGKIELGSDAKVTVTNTRNNVASLEITKVNTSNQSLPGAKFTLTLDGDSAKTYNVTSDENGLLKFENLSVGTYTLTETEAPSGYVKSTESYKVKYQLKIIRQLLSFIKQMVRMKLRTNRSLTTLRRKKPKIILPVAKQPKLLIMRIEFIRLI